jgi:hypothetical protein
MTKFVLPDRESLGRPSVRARGILGTSRTGVTVGDTPVTSLSCGPAGVRVVLFFRRSRFRAHQPQGHAPCLSILTSGTEQLYTLSVSMRSELNCNFMNSVTKTTVLGTDGKKDHCVL